MYEGKREMYFSCTKEYKKQWKNVIIFLELLPEKSYRSNIKLDLYKQLPLQEPLCRIKTKINIGSSLRFLKGQSFHMQTSCLIWIRHQSAGKTCYMNWFWIACTIWTFLCHWGSWCKYFFFKFKHTGS